MLTLMAVHAHPDDEATSTGGVLAKYASEGARTVLVTCTDGRCGDGPGGLKPGDEGHDPAAVVAMRQAELEASCSILKVSDLELLGYGDSGMMGWATNEAPGAFWQTPVPEAAARLAALMEEYRPDVVVTYDENGFYGHPDHIQAHRITVAALELISFAPKFYYTTAPRSMFEKMGELMKESGMEMPDDEDWDGPPVGLPDEEISTWVDVQSFSDEKFDALAAHGSQGDNIFFVHMGKERFREIMGIETFVRKDKPASGESDLFEGLR